MRPLPPWQAAAWPPLSRPSGSCPRRDILLSSTPSTIAASWDAPCTAKNTYTVDLALLKKGYTILDRAVLEQELTDSALIVLCAIIVCAGNSSRAFPSISALQKKTAQHAPPSAPVCGCSRPLKPCWCSSASRRTRSIVAIPITSAASQRAIMQRLLVTSISQLRMRVKPRSRAFL